MKNYVVINQVNTFGCRVNGYMVYSYTTQEILGLTESTILKMLKAGDKIYGLAVGEDNHIILDEANFYQNNILVMKTISKAEPLHGDLPVNTFYTLIAVKEDGFEVINSRYAKSILNKQKLVNYLELGIIQGGCTIGEDGELKVAECLTPSAPVAKEPDKPSPSKKPAESTKAVEPKKETKTKKEGDKVA